MDEYCQFYIEFFHGNKDRLLDHLGEVVTALWEEDEKIIGIIPVSQKEQLEKYLDLLESLPITFHPLEDRDWLQEDQEKLPPLETEKFFLYGSHYFGEIPKDKLSIVLDSATAFGSGHHETTHSCLELLEHIATRHQITKSLDVGCGSGVLSFAIASLWNAAVFACDIDPESVRITQENAKRNGFSGITVCESNGFANQDLQKSAPYDLIVANIHSGPLCGMAEEMIRLKSQDGFIILSGFLCDQVAEIKEAYPLRVLQTVQKGEWVTLLLQ